MSDLENAKKDESFEFTLNEALFFRKAFVDFHEATLKEIYSLTKAIDNELESLQDR